jgi:hypothetical protein
MPCIRTTIGEARASVVRHPGLVDVRIVLGCALLLALAAGGFAVASGRDYRAHSFVIRVPPDFAGKRGLERARGDAVLRRALVLAGEAERDTGWLREHSGAELTSRLDLAFTVEAPDREQAADLATAYAKAFRREIPPRPGLTTRGRGARDARPTLGPLGWALLGGAAGLWLGAAVAIVRAGCATRTGSAPAPRPASPPCAPARRATPG